VVLAPQKKQKKIKEVKEKIARTYFL